MLREGHKANLQMAKKKQLGIDADHSVFDWEGDQHMEKGLPSSRGPIVAHLQQTSSAPRATIRRRRREVARRQSRSRRRRG